MKIVESMIEGIRELTGVEITEGDFVSVRHSLMTVLLVVAHHKAGELSDMEAANVLSLSDGLLKLQLEAHKGEWKAQTLLRGVRKLVFPPKMIRSEGNRTEPFLPLVNDLLKAYQTSPHLIHAWEVRRLMSELSFHVEPMPTDPNVKPKSDSNMKPKSRVKLRERSLVTNEKQRKEAMAVFNKADKRVRAHMTLEGLAKKVYLESLIRQNQNTKITEADLNRSLKKLRDFEKAHPEELQRSFILPIFGGEGLPYQFVSQDCKPSKVF